MNASSPADEKIVLNIGGTKYETRLSTLLHYPDSLLGVMFSDRNAHLRHQLNGEYFFDRNGQTFEVVLDFYRTGGKIIIPPGIAPESVKEELDFFQLPWEDNQPGRERLESAKQDEQRKEEVSGYALEAFLSFQKKHEASLYRAQEAVLRYASRAAQEGKCNLRVVFEALGGNPEDEQVYRFLREEEGRQMFWHVLQGIFGKQVEITYGKDRVIVSLDFWNRYGPIPKR
mmetsp:Transcript_6575/g.10230  ORF Transcript_6575/g.10230 Transcript_6575/m.10230 type:complete len:229 (+) Transcript_6575:54-740(+)|eukprot:CAMPEP_0184649106 /NCGR_PEP_ID=MMETSP0308-20130426/6357_1 /TAXON_ID=38269 /ORGANISM="Gloeochaete witrockiana, Strain SAG 46.84" /LENGTH=228 /DNA_ID=CAMNT_0027081509 /DNA_START=17 /DNA_END=703 /DNA_ORIENTATION=-